MNCPIETHQFLTTWNLNLSEKLKQQYSECWIDNQEKGYFGFIPKKSTALLVGTFPILEQRTTGFFYHSDANLFWKILKEVAGKDLTLLETKLKWLNDKNLGITDIIYKVQRIDENCSSSADKDLNVIRFNNLLSILADFPAITDVYLTSGGPKSKSLSGKSAGGWVGKHFRETTGKSIKKISSNGATLRIKIQPNERELNLHYLITPAPQDNQLGKFLRENNTIKEVFDNINIFQEITETKEKYKIIQWANYLSNIQGLVQEKVTEEIKNKKLEKLLMEKASR